MQDPRGLFDLETARTDFGEPVLLYSLAGFVDAGSAGRLLADHLVETLDHEVVATFDVDQLLDFRGRRPAMTFSRGPLVGVLRPRPDPLRAARPGRPGVPAAARARSRTSSGSGSARRSGCSSSGSASGWQ